MVKEIKAYVNEQNGKMYETYEQAKKAEERSLKTLLREQKYFEANIIALRLGFDGYFDIAHHICKNMNKINSEETKTRIKTFMTCKINDLELDTIREKLPTLLKQVLNEINSASNNTK